MKVHYLVPPAIVLLGGWFFLHRQHADISSLEQETSHLEQLVKLARQAPADSAAAARSSRASASSLTKKNSGQLDWKKIISLRAAGSEGSETQRWRLDAEMKSALLTMSPADLVAQIGEVDSLDLPEAEKKELTNRILQAMADRDPSLAVRSFASRIDSENSGSVSIFTEAFTRWISTDLASAVAWLDAGIADGIFKSKALGGRNATLTTLQGSVISTLLESNPEAAKQRALAIPEGNRENMMWLIVDRMKSETEKQTVDFIRASLPTEKRADSLGYAANRAYLAGGFEEVEGLMQSAGVTADERTNFVLRAAVASMPRSGKTEQVASAAETARQWAAKVAPGTENEVTGQVLAYSGAYRDFNAAAEIAVGYGDDGVLSAFLKSPYANSNREAAQALLDKISDPGIREQVRSQLSGQTGN